MACLHNCHLVIKDCNLLVEQRYLVVQQNCLVVEQRYLVGLTDCVVAEIIESGGQNAVAAGQLAFLFL